MRETGAMLMSLKQDEQNGVIVLPAKIEGQPNHVTIAESWLPYGVPFAVVLGLVLSNVVTNKEAIIPTFKRMMKNVRKEDMSLDLEEALGRLRRICHGVSLPPTITPKGYLIGTRALCSQSWRDLPGQNN